MTSSLRHLFSHYRVPLFAGALLFFIALLFVIFSSPHAPTTSEKTITIFYLLVLSVLFLLSFFLYHHKTTDLLTTYMLALMPVGLVFALGVPLFDAGISAWTYAFGLFGLVLFFLWMIRFLLSHVTPAKQNTQRDDPHALFSPRVSALIVFSLTLLFLVLGLRHIGQQTLVDEPLWMFNRVERYWQNFAEGDLRHTRPSDKPGVTISLLSGYALLSYPAPSTRKKTISPATREDLLVKMRAPLVVFVALLLPLFYHVTRRLFGTTVALVSMSFIALSPLLLGMTRMINPDALLWILLPLTMLLFALALSTRAPRTIIATGLFFGLALLTKYVANVLFVFFPIMIILSAILSPKNHTAHSQRHILQTAFFIYVIIIIVALGTYTILLPSTWVHPVHILKGTLWSQAFAPLWKPFLVFLLLIFVDLYLLRQSVLTRIIRFFSRYQHIIVMIIAYTLMAIILFTFVSAQYGMPFDYQHALQSPKSALRNVGALATFFADFYVLIFGISSIALFASLFALITLPTHYRKKHHTQAHTILILLTFIPFYYIGAIFGDVAATMRYQIALYPLVLLLAAIGVTMILRFLPRHLQQVTFFLLVCSLFATTLFVAPFYQSYANILLPRGDILNIKDMGDGSYQVAQYLNSLPNAHQNSVWADKSGVCASFVGSCTTTVDVTRIAREKRHFDYYVISRGRQNLTTYKARNERNKKTAPANALRFEKLYTTTTPPLLTIILAHNPANYIKIFSAQDIDLRE